MKRTSFAGMTCSLARTLDIVGEWWTLLILRDIFLGVTRFEDICRDLGIATNILTDRLATLVDNGVLVRAAYQTHPERFEYRLTEKGRDLYPAVLALLRWGDRWAADAAGPPVTLVHAACGRSTTPLVVCSHCGGPLSLETVEPYPGPGARVGPGTAVVGDLLRSKASGS